MSDVRLLYRCVLCGRPKRLQAFVCYDCYRQIQMRRRRIGLASPFSKSRRQTLPPPITKH